MWYYEKKLEYPINIKKCDLRMAKLIAAQLGGPDGELAAALRYIHQRYSMPTAKIKGVLTDIGREAPEMFRSYPTVLYRRSLFRSSIASSQTV